MPAVSADQLIYSKPFHQFSRLGCNGLLAMTPPNNWRGISGCCIDADPNITLGLFIIVKISGVFLEGEKLLVKFIMVNNTGLDLTNVFFKDSIPSLTLPAPVDLDDGESTTFEEIHYVTSTDVADESLFWEIAGQGEYGVGPTVVEASKKRDSISTS